ncbi:hypothetical protein QF030_006054 [Streptomyces rishiriensis]|uniref:Uncharacterized protein n=1 Tax=Streptomyces rishiriensis TaxID=68264 RepID=A0ABU0NXK9_STRRH|nr:hypothetical protein [Streptomyces rishiriensis]
MRRAGRAAAVIATDGGAPQVPRWVNCRYEAFGTMTPIFGAGSFL